MALPVLDGNQTATTLSSVVTGGEHIVAHSVVSLGATAIANITSAVSGSVVSISNFPSTQTVAGTVTIGNSVTANSPTRSWIDNFSNPQSAQFFPVAFDYANNQLAPIPVNDGGLGVIAVQPTGINWNISGTVTANLASANLNSVTIGVRGSVTLGAGTSQIGSVTVGNSVTIGSLPAISGTVTANLSSVRSLGQSGNSGGLLVYGSTDTGQCYPLPLKTDGSIQVAGDYIIGGGYPDLFSLIDDGGFNINNINSLPAISGTVTVGNSVTIGSLPAISGTVTANAGSGTFNVSDRGTTGVATVTSITATTSVTLMASNSSRKVLTIYNEGAGNLHVLYGSGTATTANYSVKLFSGDYLEIGKYTGQVNAIFATAGTARVTEIT